MFALKPNVETQELNRAITRVHDYMSDMSPDSEDFAAVADQLVKLYAQKKEIPSWRISPDTVLTVVGNFLGIIVIVGYEQRHVIVSKAFGFLGKATR